MYTSLTLLLLARLLTYFYFSIQIFVSKKVCDCKAGLQCLFGDFIPLVYVFHRAACYAKVCKENINNY